MSDYKLERHGGVIYRGIKAIPKEGPDWDLYLKWVAAGGVPDPADEPVPPPTPAEQLDAEATRPVLKSLIAGLAEIRGKTPAEILTWLKAKL